ncbi:dTDP-glucose 4,6-dehydratase [Candidatus Nitrosopelagicus sp.]|nr:dTDP-glucose 4,6-dehydratase [Candidatus Nitrosopelagicus sp.]
MKLLVTGGLGFIGSNFILHLLEKNENLQITNVDAELTGSHNGNLSLIEKNENYNFIKGNITNRRLMEELISTCDVVVNFAAESFVDRSISNADPFLVSNIRGAFTILDLITKAKKKMIHISTDEVFGSLKSESATEEENLNPSNPYAATKASAELLIKSYIATYDTDVIITRCTNNYGPRQFPEKLIPKTILLAKQEKNIPIYGNGKNIRDWIFVNDHCDAIYKILLNGKSQEFYNISGNNEISNLEIVNEILKIMDKSNDLIEFVDDRPGHDYRYSLNSSKINQDLNWSPKINFKNGLETTIDWYLKNSEWIKEIPNNVLNQTPWKN